ncbi:MAG TPA: (4Fe-4S)-binding protein [Desulfobacteraceae bacterium]|nr:(4Fe-4S)-binding protein [Desulfobacteraceae bacterium]
MTIRDHPDSHRERPADMVNFSVDDKNLSAPEGTSLLQACLDNGIYIPNLCYLPDDDHPPASCRLCMVDLSGAPAPVPACTVPVTEGLVAYTGTERVRRLQRSALKLLLSNHRVECARCSANKHCALQQIAKFLKVGLKRGKLADLVQEPGKKEKEHPYLKYHPARCVLCGKCVRICSRMHPRPLLFFAGRGLCTHINFFGADENTAAFCSSCFACVDICPVGALEKRLDSAESTGDEET